ncbi:MAG: ParB N-terminal domain-containing protein [Polyangiaceae bacterium]|nr:ParB N-terminal domain-containing protein [Polyangiaceae bacterium]
MSRTSLVEAHGACSRSGVQRSVEGREREVALQSLGCRLAAVRLRTPDALRRMQESLARHGQLTAVIAYRRADDGLELIDGFKRLEAARALDLGVLQVRALVLDPSEAKAAIARLNVQHGLEVLEEAWLVRLLYREDHLRQPEIARLLGRDKSWVSRRLALAESLHDRVEADLRLGLVAPSVARELTRLPRGNQPSVAEVAMQRGLTSHQTARLVQALLLCADEAGREALLAEARSAPQSPSSRGKSKPQTPAEQALADVAILTRTAGRLQARLHERPLTTLGAKAADLVATALSDLDPILAALIRTIGRVTQKESHASLVDS